MSSNLFAESLQIMTRAFNDVNQSSLVKKKLLEGKLIFFRSLFGKQRNIFALKKCSTLTKTLTFMKPGKETHFYAILSCN